MALPQNGGISQSFNQRHKRKFDDDNNFHVIVAPVLAFAQFFGFFPFVGVFSKKFEKVKFKWTSFRTVFSAMWLASATMFFFFEITKLMRDGALNPKNINGIIFYITGITSGILLFRLAFEWHSVLSAFDKIDKMFLNESYPQLSGWTLKKRIRLASVILFCFAFLEHSMSWMSFLYDRYMQVQMCGWEIGSVFYYLATTHLGQVYYYLPLNVYTVAWSEFMNLSFTFAWSFIDLFIILISISVASKFEKINRRLEFFNERIVSDDFWEEIRCHYNHVCELHDFLDEKIGNIVCLVCLNDLYYVCLQLLNVATPLPFLINSVYYWYSLIFLIARTSAVFFIASSIHDESKKPLKILRSIPCDGWFPETQRLSHQIQNSSTALSGNRFFFITRGIIISIAGTIVTYELVLLQFDGDKIVSGMFDPCPHLIENKH